MVLLTVSGGFAARPQAGWQNLQPKQKLTFGLFHANCFFFNRQNNEMVQLLKTPPKKASFWIVASDMIEYVNKWGETQETRLIDNWWVLPYIDPVTPPPLLFLTNIGCWLRMGGLYGQCFCRCCDKDGRVNSKHLCLCFNRQRKRTKLPRH